MAHSNAIISTLVENCFAYNNCPISFIAVRVTPNNVHISEGDQAIVQCEVEYPAEDQPPQSHIYVNDCKMKGYNHPSWIMRIMESDGACVHNANSETTLCHTHTVYINGTAEAHNGRIYCCARLESRVCTNSSKITIVGTSSSM